MRPVLYTNVYNSVIFSPYKISINEVNLLPALKPNIDCSHYQKILVKMFSPEGIMTISNLINLK